MKLHEYKRNYELENDYWWFVGTRAMVTELLSVCVKNGNVGRALDAGCGTGALLDELEPYSKELWGLDISVEALKYCRLRGHKRLILSDAGNTPFPSEYFTVITAIGLIEHLEDDDSFLAEMVRLLKPNGVLILLTSSFPYLWSVHDTANEHKRRYYLRQLRGKVEKTGFETIRLTHLNFFLFPIIAPILMLHRQIYGIEADDPKRLLPKLPRFANVMLTQLLIFESSMIRWVRFPWGISMIGAFKKIKQD